MKSAALETNSERRTRNRVHVCAICGDAFYNHRDGTFRCGCEADEGDPVGEIYERLKAEARQLRRSGAIWGKSRDRKGGKSKSVVPHEVELQWIFISCLSALIHKTFHEDAILICIDTAPWAYWNMRVFHHILSQ